MKPSVFTEPTIEMSTGKMCTRTVIDGIIENAKIDSLFLADLLKSCEGHNVHIVIEDLGE